MALEPEFQALKEYLEHPKMGVINVARYRELADSYEIIKKIITSIDPEATVDIEECALQTGAVAIRVVTDDVTVYDTAEFAEATKHADNFQIYPTADGRVKFDIMFCDVINYTLVDI